VEEKDDKISDEDEVDDGIPKCMLYVDMRLCLLERAHVLDGENE
jgi:hypothetical protein